MTLPNEEQWVGILSTALEEAINAQIDPSLFDVGGAGKVAATLATANAALEKLFPKDINRISYKIGPKTLPDGTKREWVYIVYSTVA